MGSEETPATINIALLGTCDSKLKELLLLRQLILSVRDAVEVTLIDVGRTPTHHDAISIAQDSLINQYGHDLGAQKLATMPRGDVINYMTKCATAAIKKLHAESVIHAIISAGGSGGSSLVAAVMREALPIGFPKLLVSTVASGDTGPLVGETDITMMYSVVDIAGSNQLLQTIFENAAAAIVGMAGLHQQRMTAASLHSINDVQIRVDNKPKKRRVGVTMFGVTTTCVDAVRAHLEGEHDMDVYVFHATGHGGRAMERLVCDGDLDAVLDITTTEICDELMGGNMSAGPERLEAAAKAGIPYVLSLGAMDMVNFGPKSTVPERYKNRKLFEHNPTVTLMRTNEKECEQVGNFVVEKLRNFATKPKMIQVVLPLGGVSIIAEPGGPFEDAKADEMLFRTIAKGLAGSEIRCEKDSRAINDIGFAVDIAKRLVSLMDKVSENQPA